MKKPTYGPEACAENIKRLGNRKRNRRHMAIGNLVILAMLALAVWGLWILMRAIAPAIAWSIDTAAHITPTDRQTLCIILAIALHAIITRPKRNR